MNSVLSNHLNIAADVDTVQYSSKHITPHRHSPMLFDKLTCVVPLLASMVPLLACRPLMQACESLHTS